MPNYDVMQKNRELIMDTLESCIKLAYSGVPEIEYNALKVVKGFIKTKYDSDKLKHDLTGTSREDK